MNEEKQGNNSKRQGAPAPAAVAKKEPTQSERFMSKVISEFGTSVGEVALTDFQKRLAQNYFISIDGILQAAEEKRLRKKTNQEPTPYHWQNVNMEKLARDVVAMARIGYDPAQPNHINPIPYKNNKTQKYDITFIEGYRGLELKAKKYGLDIPDHVTVELVYSNDTFKPVKRDLNNKYESYEFNINNPFDRGEIVGGFYYHSYSEAPEKNKLVLMTKKDIEKRKPDRASAEFWGGEKDKWENNKKVGTERVEGWYEQMCYKTVFRAAFSDITIDSQKIDDDYMRLKQMENEYDAAEVEREIKENGNKDIIDITPKGEGDPDPSNGNGSRAAGPPPAGDDFSGDVPPMDRPSGNVSDDILF